MKLDEKLIRAHLPKELENQSIDCFSGAYLDGLTVMHEGERGGDDVVVYRAKNEEDLRWWQLEHVCRYLHEPNPPARKSWRYYRHHAEDGKWLYTEHRNYDRKKLCFIEISDSKEHDGDGMEEPRPGSVIKIMD